MALDDEDMRTEAADPFDGPADGGANPGAQDGGADGSATQSKLRETFGTGSLGGEGAGTGGLGTGAGDVSGGSSQILSPDATTADGEDA